MLKGIRFQRKSQTIPLAIRRPCLSKPRAVAILAQAPAPAPAPARPPAAGRACWGGGILRGEYRPRASQLLRAAFGVLPAARLRAQVHLERTCARVDDHDYDESMTASDGEMTVFCKCEVMQHISIMVSGICSVCTSEIGIDQLSTQCINCNWLFCSSCIPSGSHFHANVVASQSSGLSHPPLFASTIVDTDQESRLKDRRFLHKIRSRSASVPSVLSARSDTTKRSIDALIDTKRMHFQLSPQLESSPIHPSGTTHELIHLANVPALPGSHIDSHEQGTSDVHASQSLFVPQIPPNMEVAATPQGLATDDHLQQSVFVRPEVLPPAPPPPPILVSSQIPNTNVNSYTSLPSVHGVASFANLVSVSRIDPAAPDYAKLAETNSNTNPVAPNPQISMMRDVMLEALDLKLFPITSSIQSLGQNVSVISSQLQSVLDTASTALQKSEEALGRIGYLEYHLRSGEFLGDVQRRLHELEHKASTSASGSSVPPGLTIDQPAQDHISKIEHQLNLLSIGISEGKAVKSSPGMMTSCLDSRITVEQSITMVVGGFPLGACLADCSSWILGQLSRLNCPALSKVYVKGSAFKQMLWIRFASSAQRSNALQALISDRPSMSNHQIWMSEDLPLDMRCEKSFFFWLKRLLISWGWLGSETRVDLESGMLLIDGHVTITMKIECGKIKISYADGWEARLDDPAYHALIRSIDEKLKKKPVSKGFKGAGK